MATLQITAAPAAVSNTTSAVATLLQIYATDFSEYPTGTPSGWTDFWSASGFAATVEANSGEDTLGTKQLAISSTADSRKVLIWDDVGSISDSDTLVKIKAPATEYNSASGFRVYARVGGSSGSENAYFAQISNVYVYFYKFVAGSYTGLGYKALSLVEDTHYWVRFNVKGTSLKVKIWDVQHVEPEDWLIETTDSSLTSGYNGIGSGANGHDYDIDYFACNITGDPMPFYPEGWSGDNRFGPFNRAGTTTTLTTVNFMGGAVPYGLNKTLTGFRVHVGATHTDQIRCAVYSGGSLSGGPDGASLLYDFGQTSGSDTDQWLELTGANVAVPDDAPLWLAIKSDAGFNFSYSADIGNAGNFQIAKGRYRTASGVDTDDIVAWPSTLSITGAFANFWYAIDAVFASPIGLTASCSAASSSSTADATITRKITASCSAVSLTSDATGLFANEKQLTATCTAASITTTATSKVVTSVSASCPATSTTQSVVGKITHSLTVSCGALSATSSVEAKTKVVLSVSSTAVSATSTAIGLSHNAITASCDALSETSIATAKTGVGLAAESNAVSITQDAVPTVLNSLAASCDSVSGTTAAESKTQWNLIADCSAASATPNITPTVHNGLTVGIYAQSATGAVEAVATVGLFASCPAVSQTSDADSVNSELLSISGAVSAVSQTSIADPKTTARLSSSPGAVSETSSAAGYSLNHLVALCAAMSDTTNVKAEERSVLPDCASLSFVRERPVMAFVESAGRSLSFVRERPVMAFVESAGRLCQ